MKTHAIKSLLLAAAILITTNLTPAFYSLGSSTSWVGVVAFYSLLNILFAMWVKKAQNSSPLSFSIMVNGMTAAKIFITLGIITVYLIAGMPEKTKFALGVFVVFVCNSTLFVLGSNKIIRKG